MSWNNSQQTGADFEERVRANQQRLGSKPKVASNFVPCRPDHEALTSLTRCAPSFCLGKDR
jgi:hypothetical protein